MKKRFALLALLCLAAVSCREHTDPLYPVDPVNPDETIPWSFAISDLTQLPCPSTEFTNVCPLFSPDGSTAYFMSSGKNVVAVNVASGKVKWQTNDTGQFSYPTATTMTQPAVNPVTGEIYVNCHISKTETNVFLALDPTTGRIAKKLEGIGIFAGNLSGPAVTADGKYVYIGTNGATLRCVDTETFEVVGYMVSTKGFRHILVEGDKGILVGNHNEIYLCYPDPDAKPGSLLIHSEPILGDPYYAVTTSFPCFSKDGLRIWMPSADTNVFGGAAPGQGFVTCIDLAVWESRNYPVEGANYVWNVISDEEGCFYVTASSATSSKGAFVRKYSPDFSSELWTWTVPNSLVSWANGLQRSMPALGDDGNLYIVSRENNCVFCVDAQSGEGIKLLLPPASAFPNKAQTGVNISGGNLVTAYTGLRSGVVAGVAIAADAPKSWSCVVGDPCGSKCYETAWGESDKLGGIDIPIGAQNTYMYDAKSNVELLSSMLAFLDKAAAKVAGTPLAAGFAGLKSDVTARMGSEPFAWIDQVNSFVTKTLADYPPCVCDAVAKPEGDVLARQQLLLLKDYPLHEVSLASDVVPMEPGQADALNASMRKMQEATVDKLLSWLDTPAPAPGVLELFKIYNMGYVARTADHCVGIDINWWGTDAQMRMLCDHIEAIFVSHAHGDHFNLPLLTEMSAREGKSLFMTTHTKSMFSPKGVGTLYAWDTNRLDAIDCGGLLVRSAIGAQGEEPCQLFCIEMDDFCIWACGDNGQASSFDTAKANFTVPDLTMVSVAGAANQLNAAARAAKSPKGRKVAYVVSHENEVGHPIDGRVSYKFFFESPRTLPDTEYAADLGNYVTLDYGEILTLTAE